MVQYCKTLRLGFLFLTLSPVLSQNMASVKEIDMTMKRIRASLILYEVPPALRMLPFFTHTLSLQAEHAVERDHRGNDSADG